MRRDQQHGKTGDIRSWSQAPSETTGNGRSKATSAEETDLGAADREL
jgi:hypothetical protein